MLVYNCIQIITFMDGKDSISFGSNYSNSVWMKNQQAIRGFGSSLTFNQMEPTSQHDLTQSMIKSFPGPNFFMGSKIQIVCLMQAAQIQRLTVNLQEYRTKFKQLRNMPLDRQSYEMQICELSQICHKLQVQNDKFKEYLTSQNSKITFLSQKARDNEHIITNNSQLQYEIETISIKYQKALAQIDVMYKDNQQFMEQISNLQQKIEDLQSRKQIFQQQKIRQIHRMRQSFQSKIKQQHTQLQEKTIIISEKLTTELKHKINQIQSLNINLKRQLEQNKTKTKRLQQQNQKMEQRQKQLNQRYVMQMAQRNAYSQKVDQNIALFAAQIQRLNQMLKDKVHFCKNLAKQNQQNINQKNKITVELQNILAEMKFKLNHKQQQLSQVFEKAAKQRQQYEKLCQIITQKEQDIKSYFNRYQHLQVQNSKLKSQISILRTKVQELLNGNQSSNQYKDKIIKQYEQKIKSYFQHNQKLKNSLNQNKNVYQTKLKQKQKVQSSFKNVQNQNKSLKIQIQVKSKQILQKSEKINQLIFQSKNYCHDKISANYIKMLDQIQNLNKNVLRKTDQNKNMTKQIQILTQVIYQLQKNIFQIKISLQNLIVEEENVSTELKSGNSKTVRKIQNLQQKATQQLQLMNKISQAYIISGQQNQIFSKLTLTHLQKQSEMTKLRDQNKKLGNILMQLKSDNKQSQEITVKAIQLAKQNSQLKFKLQNQNQYLQGLRYEGQKIKEQLISNRQKNDYNAQLFKQKQRFIEQQSSIIQILKQKIIQINVARSQQLNDKQKNDKLLKNFKQLNESLLMKASQSYNQQETSTYKNLQSTTLMEQNKSHGINIKNIQKELETSKQQLQSCKRKIIILCQNRQKLNQQIDQLKKQKIDIKIKLQSNDKSRLQLNQQIHQLKQKNSAQNSQHYYLQQQLKQFKDQLNFHQVENTKIYQQRIKMIADIQRFKKQLNNRQRIIQNYNEKIQILTVQFQRLQSIINHLKSQNVSLKSINYDVGLQLQKSKVTTRKIDVLNVQINRLQRENIDLISQIDICRFQIAGDSSLYRKNEQLLILLVATYAQIQSLRSRMKIKDDEIDTIRKKHLSSYRKQQR